ncbi:MAG TPA: hypothetical protein VMT15_06660 [Bryobacteraceae bacterium]|nr:hypothetical protein [Bryobacteraceae bacterium]
MLERTSFLGKLIGLYCILVALCMMAHRQATLDAVTAILHNPALMYVLGVFTIIAGLAMVLGHNVWSGGALPVAITIVGWISLIKGLLFLLLPDGEAAFFLGQLHYDQLFWVYMAVCLAFGACLTYGGFSAETK